MFSCVKNEIDRIMGCIKSFDLIQPICLGIGKNGWNGRTELKLYR